MTIICFDVDGSLINLKDDSPRYDIIQLLLTFKRLGYNVRVWSGGGVEYAQRWVEKLGLDVPVVDKGSITPDIAFDDEAVKLGVINLRV